MKKFTLIAALFASVLSTNTVTAQSFTVDKDTATSYWIPGGYMVESSMNVSGVSSTPIEVNWKVVNYQLGPKWSFQGFCDNVECKYESTPGLLDGSKTFTTAPFASFPSKANFRADFWGDTALNNTKSMITIEVSEGATSKRITFIAYKNPTGIISTSVRNEDDISIFPNPASSYIDVRYSPSSDVKTIAIYNLIGKVVNIYKTTDRSSARCEFNADMPSGIYVVRIGDSKGNIIATRKITHQ